MSGIGRLLKKNVSGIWWSTEKSVSRRGGRGTKKAAAHPPEDIFWNSPYFRIAWVGEYPTYTAVNLAPANRVTAKRISVKGDSAKGNDTLPLYQRHE